MTERSRQVKLGDYVTFVSGGTPSKARADFWGGDVPWFSAKDMKQPRLTSSEDHLTFAGAAGSRLVPSGTVLILVRGMTLHKTIPIGITTVPATFNQDVKAITPKEGLDSRFLFYTLMARRPDLLRLVDATSHGTGRIHTHLLEELLVDLPSIEEQRAIADMLSLLDDKIDANVQVREAAISLGRALFAERMRGSSKRLGDLLELHRGISYAGSNLVPAGIPMANMGTFGEDNWFHADGLKAYKGPVKASQRLVPGDLIIANTDMTQRRAYLGRPALIPPLGTEFAVCTHHVFVTTFIANPDDDRWLVFFGLQQPAFRARAEGVGTGTTVAALPREDVLAYEMPWIEDEATRASIARKLELLVKVAWESEQETMSLAGARDRLTRDLISGTVTLRRPVNRTDGELNEVA